MSIEPNNHVEWLRARIDELADDISESAAVSALVVHCESYELGIRLARRVVWHVIHGDLGGSGVTKAPGEAVYPGEVYWYDKGPTRGREIRVVRYAGPRGFHCEYEHNSDLFEFDASFLRTLPRLRWQGESLRGGA